MIRKLFLYFLIGTAAAGCKIITPSIMLRTPKDFKYSQLPDTVSLQYKISKADQLQFRLFANDGFKMIDVTNEQGGGGGGQMQVQNATGGAQYLVEFDGTVKFPILGRIPLVGMTNREAELMLQDKYSAYFHNPYVLLSVSNRRVLLFPGADGKATVITLRNDNTTLIEAIAFAGGISDVGKAHKIKLIRGNPDNPEVYLIDLSKIYGIKQGSIVLQSNDIIYIEPRYKVVNRTLNEVAPYFSIISSVALIYTTIKIFGPKK